MFEGVINPNKLQAEGIVFARGKLPINCICVAISRPKEV